MFLSGRFSVHTIKRDLLMNGIDLFTISLDDVEPPFTIFDFMSFCRLDFFADFAVFIDDEIDLDHVGSRLSNAPIDNILLVYLFGSTKFTFAHMLFFKI